MTPDDTPSAPSPELLDALQHQVALFARRAEQTRLAGSATAPAGGAIDRAAYLLLSRLDRHGPTGVKALAAGMGIDSSTVTRQVAPLVEAGLVLRDPDPDDGRAVVLRLAPLGRAGLDEVRRSRRQLMALLTDDWTDGQRADFAALLTRFNEAIAAWQSAPPTGRAPAATEGDRPPA
ncbi:MarR family transcriptional regulator [Streptomyces sp. RFCAC02]|uniref:MarR family winged helix-turn-helix transcriptional regulator n=1 Tax=Streptomyces sp. RFCAC02 TaxID=2499143 RepID=UPI00101F4EF2|nr:MarR family transcriptional regulator [Streptomyces sp. RFCAC02]